MSDDSSAGFTVDDAPPGNGADNDNKRQAQRELIIEAVQAAGVLFWHDPDGHAFASVPLAADRPEGAVMHLRVRGRRFALVCRRLYGVANPVQGARGFRPGSVSDTAMSEAIPAFEAMALDAPEYEPGVRLMLNGDSVWIDLGDKQFRSIRVTAKGWTVEERTIAHLVRPDGMRALPIPVRDGGALKLLQGLFNLPDDDEGRHNFRLIAAWLVAALYPTGPYSVLAVDGEQGSGKSTVCRMLRRLVDPNAADLRATPRSEDDLLIAAMNGRVVALDNVSHIEGDMADALCRLATGAGFGKRTLYSDLGETIVAVSRPILLNGIPSLLARADLADRSIAVTLQHIPDDKRRPESEVWSDFGERAPAILALLLDALVVALGRLPTLQLARLPRMADFARLACAAAPAFGWSQDDMLAALDANREASVETILAADPIAEAVRAIADKSKPQWEGTATGLLEAVNALVSSEGRSKRGWPVDGARLSTRLRRLAPALRRGGVEVILPTSGGRDGRKIIIRPVDIRNQRSQRSERSSGGQASETEHNPRNAGRTDERSQNASSVPDRSVNPLKSNAWNGGNAGNAESRQPEGEADGADADELVL